MEKQLEKYLLNEASYLYAILDGAAVPDLPMKMYEMRPHQICLYRGELEPDLAEVAPYLVYLMPETEFTDWVLANCWGKHWGIFVQTQFSMVEVRKQFRRLLTVHDEAGNPLLFRYYDPRVLSKFLPTCESEDLKLFFDRASAIFAESDDAQELIRFQAQGEQLIQTVFSVAAEEPFGGYHQPVYTQPSTGFNNYA
jgi:hypothetical protein